MIEWIIIGILIVVCLILFLYVYSLKRNSKDLLQVLKKLKEGDNRKLFAKGNSKEAEIIYTINEIIENLNNQILDYRKKEENNHELLTSLSHDIRTPVASLIGYMDALNDKILNEQEQHEYIEVCRNKAYFLKDYINLLFDWFKINSDEMQYSFEKIDINEFTREILIEWIPVLKEKNIILQTELPHENCFCKIDRKAYTRIINNLLQNSILHSNCKNIKINSLLQDGNALLTITDDGKGIDEDKVQYVFKRLYKCDESRRSQGSGLGLAIVKELVSAHDGTIEVKSVPCFETTFTISIPLYIEK